MRDWHKAVSADWQPGRRVQDRSSAVLGRLRAGTIAYAYGRYVVVNWDSSVQTKVLRRSVRVLPE